MALFNYFNCIAKVALTIQIQPVESDPFIDFTEQAQDTDQSPWNKKQKIFS